MDATNPTRCLKVVVEIFIYALDISGTPGNYTFSGPMVTILHIIEKHLGLCFQLMRSKHREYGRLLPNGSWTGIMGLLQRQEMDCSGTLFTPTPERIATLDFSEAIYLDEMNVMYARPGVSPDVAGFIKPYTPLVWLLLLLTTLLVFAGTQAVLWGVDFVQRSSTRKQKLSSMDSNIHMGDETQDVSEDGGKKVIAGMPLTIDQCLKTVERSAMWTWPVLLSQSVTWVPSGGLAQSLVGLWLLMSFTLGSVYRSNLKAMLIYPRIHFPFTNLEELANSNIPTAVTTSSVMHQQIINADNSSSLGKLRDQMRLYYSDQSHFIKEETFRGRHAGISFDMVLRGGMHAIFSMTGRCIVYLMPRGFLGPVTLSLAFPKGSPLRSRFNQVIVRLRESGIITKAFSDRTINATDCISPVSSMAIPSKRPLQVKDFYGILLLYVLGLLLAADVFLVELVFVACRLKEIHFPTPWSSDHLKMQPR
ncbi:glutamate receptor ionotropic, kainate 5-like [Scylla paramamosain]|uniref:glutamate receptor ionotropic, kainate 5-like n=1 Tax=Scylla paramamosain TaxID=85552 RepID=UPI0030836A5F